MKGLLKKDFYVFLGTSKLFMLMLIFLACIPGETVFSYVMLYCSLLVPITLMANDEQSKWDELAAMLPYSTEELVLSKYLISWLMLLIMSALHILSSALLGGVELDMSLYRSMAVYISIALALNALTIPINCRFGVNRGRLAVVVIVGVFVAFTAFTVAAADVVAPVLPRLLRSSYVPLAALALNFLSIPISVACYKARMDK